MPLFSLIDATLIHDVRCVVGRYAAAVTIAQVLWATSWGRGHASAVKDTGSAHPAVEKDLPAHPFGVGEETLHVAAGISPSAEEVGRTGGRVVGRR